MSIASTLGIAFPRRVGNRSSQGPGVSGVWAFCMSRPNLTDSPFPSAANGQGSNAFTRSRDHEQVDEPRRLSVTAVLPWWTAYTIAIVVAAMHLLLRV